MEKLRKSFMANPALNGKPTPTLPLTASLLPVKSFDRNGYQPQSSP
jgi:hypothetical protein